jgi:arsenite methyltransferase
VKNQSLRPDLFLDPMQTHAIAPPTQPPARNQKWTAPALTEEYGDTDSLFEHLAWLYVFLREHVFRDDTKRMIPALWPERNPGPGTMVIEIGCGPGFYARRLAGHFPNLLITGVDRSQSQVRWARWRAANEGLVNCTFKRVNALMLPFRDAQFQVLIASRFFTILPDPNRAIAEMYRVLKPGGRCFIAEPRHAFWASIPLFAMWLLAGIMNSRNGCREPRRAKVFPVAAFERLFAAHPWKSFTIWRDGGYQYALCEKA